MSVSPGLIYIVLDPSPDLGRLAYRWVGTCEHGQSYLLLYGKANTVLSNAKYLGQNHRDAIGGRTCHCAVGEIVMRIPEADASLESEEQPS